MAIVRASVVTEIIAAWAGQDPDVRKAYLYGSVARGDNKYESDIDVAVQLNAGSGDTDEYSVWIVEAERMKKSLQELLPGPLQLEWYHPVETPTIRLGVRQSSILVYDQQQSTTTTKP